MKSEWRMMKLGDMCKISSSKRIFAKEYCGDGIPFYRGKEIIEKHKGYAVSTELFISEERYEQIKEQFDVPKIGDILLSSVGTLGIPWLVDEEKFYFKDGNLTWLRAGKGLDNKFLYLWLCSPEAKRQIDAKCIGSTQKAITIQALNKFDIRIPDIDTQRKISNLLFVINKKLVLNKEINDNLQQQAMALYGKFFPYAVTDELPAGWRVGTVGEIVEIHDSKRIPLSGAKRAKMEKRIYPYYGAASLVDYVDEYIFDGKYLLLGEDGTVVDNAGYPILQYVWGKFWVNNHAHILTGCLGHSVESLLLLFKRTPVKSIVTGAVQPKISQANLRSVQVVIPPHNETDAFNKLICPLFAQIRQNQDENKALASLRDTLIPGLMSGEVDVSGIQL